MKSPAPRILRVEGLSCQLGGKPILQGLTLPALSGGLVALLGPNGSGKSTLLRSIAGLAPARFDTLSLNGQDLRGLPARVRADTIRYLPQFLPEAIHLTVTEALLVALHARGGLSTAAAMERGIAALDTLGIRELGPRFLDELSGGQKQLVGLAQALADQPAVLLLDEPLASLDLNFQHHAMLLLKRLAADQGLLVLIVVHDLNIALRYADTALLLHQGRLLAAGEPRSVITPASIAQAFQVRARVEPCSLGYANVLVDDLIQP
ncbi:MAG: ABC transporter ATP-binding protein [Burkholderiaceae bacterium]